MKWRRRKEGDRVAGEWTVASRRPEGDMTAATASTKCAVDSRKLGTAGKESGRDEAPLPSRKPAKSHPASDREQSDSCGVLADSAYLPHASGSLPVLPSPPPPGGPPGTGGSGGCDPPNPPANGSPPPLPLRFRRSSSCAETEPRLSHIRPSSLNALPSVNRVVTVSSIWACVPSVKVCGSRARLRRPGE